MAMEHVDVLIIGAGLSGIGAAYHLQQNCPNKSYLILEAREAMGGTWDLFRYPGIRSDSDMHTLGYNFKPWRAAKAIADGPDILEYIHETARENNIEGKIRYKHRVSSASWSSDKAQWLIEVQQEGGDPALRISCNFLLMCSGYYSYQQGYTPHFEGRELFQGPIIHPQQWPEDLDYSGKRVVVIGSGATAMTLVPAMAQDAEHVVMLQRSPTYVLSRPDKDAIANNLRKILPEKWAYGITRWKNISAQQRLYQQTRTRPQWVKKKLLGYARKALGPDYDVDTHFTPDYNPWDQRLCLIPNDDLFEVIKSGKASIVTDHINSFTESGILLKSGRLLDTDIIVTATGLNMLVLGGIEFSVDGKVVDFSDTWSYKGLMYSGVPNLVNTFGYINASWTLRADITADYFCRLINHMHAQGAAQVVPQLRESDKGMQGRPWVDDFSSGYMQRAMHQFPKQGNRDPWVNSQNYIQDKKVFREGRWDDGALLFH